MNIRFTKLIVEGFQSIGKRTEFDLDGQGITLIKGVNEYEGKASSNGSGKCFGANTKIQMFDGTFKNVENIKVGDIVLGWDSTPRKVLETHTGNGRLLKVSHYNDDYSYVCNDAHILTLRTPVKNGERKVFDIDVSEYMKQPDWWKKQNNQFIKPMYYGNEDSFYIDPYTLGVWLGDGSSTSAFVTTADIEVLDYWRSLAPRYNLRIKEYQKPNNKALSVGLVKEKKKDVPLRNPFISELKRLNVYKNKRIPEEYLLSSFSNRMQLLAGLLDTDGFYDTTKNSYEFCQVRENLTEDVIRLARSLGLRVTKKVKMVNGKPYYRLYITGNNLDEIPLKVNHKKALKVKKQRADSISFDVEEYGYGTYYGFSIEGDGRFLLANGLVVHNSSLLEALNWCLFGKTSSGVLNVSNRYFPDGCFVSVTFFKNSEEYLITRSIDHKEYKTGIILKCNGNDISCRNKSDTDKIIKDILPFNQDIFLSTIFLSQGFSGRMSLLSPTARKERLEVLSNIDENINKFKNQVSDKKSVYSDSLRECDKKVSYINGQLDAVIRNKENAERLKEKTVDIPDVDIDSVSGQLGELESTIESLKEEAKGYSEKVSKCEFQYSSLVNEKNRINREKSKLEAQANAIGESFECPTCHQTVSTELGEEIKADIMNKISELEDELFDKSEQIVLIESDLNAYKKISEDANNRLNTMSKTHRELTEKVNAYNKAVRDNATLQGQLANLANISELDKNILDLNSQIQEVGKERSDIEIDYNISDHILKLITKEFRTFLLTDIINFMNEKLKYYSDYLFENPDDKIWVSSDTSKLSIMMNESAYESLSGGEKKKVDIALVLAQRDLALKVSGFNCNLLVLDEILENLDECASNASLKLLNDVSENIESVYLISHNNYSLPIDNTITAVKGEDRITKFMYT